MAEGFLHFLRDVFLASDIAGAGSGLCRWYAKKFLSWKKLRLLNRTSI
jgi:hypothetical protein